MTELGPSEQARH